MENDQSENDPQMDSQSESHVQYWLKVLSSEVDTIGTIPSNESGEKVITFHPNIKGK